MVPTALLIAVVAFPIGAPVAAAGSEHELLRGGIPVSAPPKVPGAPGAPAQNPALNAQAPSKRESASDPGAELRTQGALRRDAFRLLLGAGGDE
jgi:hypothetical protein